MKRKIDLESLPLKDWKKEATMFQDDYTAGAGTSWLLNVAKAENKMIWEMIRVIEEAPTLTAPNEWVSVEDRLPPDMGDVLVAAFWHERWQTMIGWHSDSRKGSWRVYTSHGEVVPGGVTHWMPLPTPSDRRPPEGEEANNE